jgi:nicotinamide-nucleotide amidase
MTREKVSNNRIALLATGDEISHGDILNTNTQEIAATLFDHGMTIGVHVTTGDNINDIEKAISFLLENHRALIITGGLGPTSDDLTRYALANALHEPLVFNDSTWEAIVKRLKHFGYDTPPDSNRQQALFPKNALIIPNPNGTAAGCMINLQNQLVFMLPGPPIECLPMIESTVLPTLTKHHFKETRHHQKWFLFGVSEGQIAEELDAVAKPYDCITGYRLWYPYIEFKIFSNNDAHFQSLLPKIQKIIAPYIIQDGQDIASSLLKKELTRLTSPLIIADFATGGLLESTLRTPETHTHLIFSHDMPHTHKSCYVLIKGLNELWEDKKNVSKTSLEMTIDYNQSTHIIKKDIPFRGIRVKQYAVEYICWQLYQFITTSLSS